MGMWKYNAGLALACLSLSKIAESTDLGWLAFGAGEMMAGLVIYVCESLERRKSGKTE